MRLLFCFNFALNPNEMNIVYRKVAQKDNANLAKMIRAVFEEFDAPRTGTVFSDPTTDRLYELFQESKAVLWIAEMDSKAIGCCGIYPTEGLEEGYAELVKFYLSEKARGKGIGKELMERSLASAKEFGYQHIYIESLPVFSKAVGMYEKSGFQLLDQPLGNSGHTSCDVWMLKSF